MRKIQIPDEGAESLFGTYDENLKQLESQFGVRIRTSGSELIVEGEPADVGRAEKVLDQLASLMRGGYRLGAGDVQSAPRPGAPDANRGPSAYPLRPATTTSGQRQRPPHGGPPRRRSGPTQAIGH